MGRVVGWVGGRKGVWLTAVSGHFGEGQVVKRVGGCGIISPEGRVEGENIFLEECILIGRDWN